MPSFTYTTNIPIGNQTPAAQRPSLQVNTNSIGSWVSVDHYGFGTAGSFDGYHQKSTYVDQVSDQASVVGADVVYGKTVASGLIEMFMRRPAESAIQMSTGSPIIGAAFSGGGAAPGQTFLPGGLQLKWGLVSFGGSVTNVSTTFTSVGLTTFPDRGLTGWIVGYNADGPYNVQNVTKTAIVLRGIGNALWFALGA